MERDSEGVGIFDDAVSDSLEKCAEGFLRRVDLEFGGIQGRRRNVNYNDDDDSEDSEDYDVSETVATEANTHTTADPDPDPCNTSALDDTLLLSTTLPTLTSLTNEISNLSTNLMKHVHITTPSQIDQHLHSFHTKLKAQIPPRIYMEKTKAAKREQAIFQRFESMAGLASRSLAEENAARVASLQMLEEKVLEAGGWDEKRTCRFLDEIQEIRNMLESEREERVRNDALVLEQIVECRVKLHKTLLEHMTEE